MAKATTKFFELIIGQKDGEVHSGDVPVRWCVSNGLVEHLEEQGRLNPHILLVPINPDTLGPNERVRWGGEVGERKLVPMKDLMTYVRFNRPGKCRLLAFIVSSTDGTVKGLKRTFLRKESGEYWTDLLCDGELYSRENLRGVMYEEHVDVNIEVPEGVFGKEPAPWRKWFANLWMRGDLEDECHFRQRFWLLGALKFWPIAAVATWFFVIRGAIALSMFLMGYKNVDWAPVVQPFDSYTRWVHIKCKNSDNVFLNMFKVDRNDKNDAVQNLSSMSGFFLTPFFLILIVLLLVSLSLIADFGFWTGLVWMLIIMMCTAGVMLFTIGFLMLLEKTRPGKWLGRKLSAFFDSIEQWYLARTIEANRLDDVPELICPKNQDNVIRAVFSDIPWHRRSIKLWFEAAKNAVCKPMVR